VATSATALAGAAMAAAGEVQRRVPRVDTHLHCFAGKEDPRFPYHARGPYQPDVPATSEHLLKCMDGAGVDFAVVVHPEPYQDDHRYLADIDHLSAEDQAKILGGTAMRVFGFKA